jgi:hypothetical protein
MSSVTVCLVSRRTRDSSWVDRELEISRSKGKGIVGIVLKDKENEVKTYGDCPQLLDGKMYKVYHWDRPETMQRWIEEAERNR